MRTTCSSLVDLAGPDKVHWITSCSPFGKLSCTECVHERSAPDRGNSKSLCQAQIKRDRVLRSLSREKGKGCGHSTFWVSDASAKHVPDDVTAHSADAEDVFRRRGIHASIGVTRGR
jgi:hypothetical protein